LGCDDARRYPLVSLRRILFLITDLEIGGTPTVVREVATRLAEPGEVHVEVACLAPWGPVADQLADRGIPVLALGARRSIELPRIVRRLVRLICDSQIDTVLSFLIHANAASALAAAGCRGRNVRFIQSIQTTQPRPRWHWWLQRLVHFAAGCIVVPSPSAADVAHAWADVPHDKISIIPNAIDPDEFVGVSGAHPRRASATFTIGFIGRLDPVKRIGDLITAVGTLGKSYRLEIFGEGKERDHLVRIIARLGLRQRVKLRGAIARPQDALAEIDLLALPSAAEGFGLVLIEAMASGVPVVATRVAGIRDVVRDGQTGLLVPVASPAELASAMRRACEDTSLRRRLIDQALRDVQRRFTWDVVLPQYRQLLQLDTNRR
jgi:glycosyltransferase involved in cell wall biosynthesis